MKNSSKEKENDDLKNCYNDIRRNYREKYAEINTTVTPFVIISPYNPNQYQ